MKEPKIRFNGFRGEWETSIIGDMCSISTGKSNTQDKIEDGKYPFYVRSPYVERSNKFLFDEEAVLTVGDGVGTGKVFHYVNGKYDLHQRVYRMFDFRNIYAKYFYYYFSTKFYKRVMSMTAKSSVDSVRMDMIADMKIDYPSTAEQQSIASYFQHLDSLIQSTTKKIESLKQVKAASLQSMFPQEGETTPRVRFKGFVCQWKKVRLSEILVERHESSTITPELPQLSFTIADGVISPEDRKSNQRDFLIKDKDNKRYLVTRVGDIIYNPANVVYGAIHRNSLIDGVVSPIYRIFSTEQDSRFMECVVRRPSFISKLAMKTEGTVTKLKTLKPEAFLDMTVCIPTDVVEQKMIGEYFTSLDRQISLQTQRLEKLKQIKSACLDNMFV